jgi:cation diffusion facilitator CzcD-associated flavoprotein CzcO
VYQHVLFNHRVQAAHWDDRKAKWTIDVVGVLDQKERKSFEGDIFVNAGGILNDWKWPDIPGLANFKGQTIHTARWVWKKFTE